jgi:transcriptional regulator with XRE-family HTH domain
VARNEKFSKALGKRIEKLKKERNLSYSDLAALCDMDKAQIYEIVTKCPDVRLSTLLKIADAFKMSVSELLNF